MHGNIKLVRPLDEMELVNREDDKTFSYELARDPTVDLRIRSVTADTLGVEDADAKRKISHALVRADVKPDLDAFTRLEQMRRLRGRANHFDCRDLRLARSPSALARPEHVRGLGCTGIRDPGSGIRLGLGNWDWRIDLCSISGQLHVFSARDSH